MHRFCLVFRSKAVRYFSKKSFSVNTKMSAADKNALICTYTMLLGNFSVLKNPFINEFSGKKNRTAILYQNYSSDLVAGEGFEPSTFGL